MSAHAFRIRGWHVLLFLIAFFGIMMAVNTVFVVEALATHPGDDLPDAYEQGLAFNTQLQANRAQAGLGWQANVGVRRDAAGAQTISISIEDKSGAPVTGLRLAGQMRHPAAAALDRPIAFKQVAPGKYEAAIANPEQIHWDLDLTAKSDMHPNFRMRHRL